MNNKDGVQIMQPQVATKRNNGILNTLEAILQRRREKGLIRQLYTPDTSQIDFSSNDYLGLARNREVLKEIEIERQRYYEENDKHLGSTGSRLLSGNSSYYENLETSLAEFHGGEAALLFNSGYDLNLGLLSSLPQRGDLVIYDEFAHNSMREGLRLCRAQSVPFKHNDLADLRRVLSQVGPSVNNVLVVVESVYSMDGHCAPLKELCDLIDEFGADLIVDEAHGTGVYGKGGRGLVSELGLEDRVMCRVHTFGKALGAHGGVLIGPQVLREYLINYARPLIYSTSLPAESLIAIKCAYRVMAQSARERQARLFKLVSTFLQRKQQVYQVMQSFADAPHAFRAEAAYLDSPSPIQGIIIPGNARVVAVGAHLQRSGFDVKPIRSPTVPAGTERLRIIIHEFNTEDQVHRLMDAVLQHVHQIHSNI